MAILQIIAALDPYPSASSSESLSPLQFSCVRLQPTRSVDPAVEDPLFGSSQLSGFQDISLIKAGSHTFNQSTISLTIQSRSQGSKQGLRWERHRIANKIHLLDVDAWGNAKLQSQ